MKRTSKWIAFLTPLAVSVLLFGASPQSGSSRSEKLAPNTEGSSDKNRAEAVLSRYCLTCHNEKAKTAGLALSAGEFSEVPAHAEKWEKVIRKLRTKTMPPAGVPRPDQAGYDSLASYLENKIDESAAAHPNPGHTEPVHRLNRTEYQNAIRDLLALDVDGSALLPADDQSYGFDNIAGVLKMSPTLLERYMGAAREISRLAIGTSKLAPAEETVRLRSDLSQYDQLEGLPFGTRGGAAVQYNFPQDGEYVIKAELLDLFAGAQVREPHQLEVAIDGERVKVFTLAPRRPPARPAPQDPTQAQNKAPEPPKLSPEDLQALGFGGKPPEFEVRVPVKAGPRLVTVTFVKKTSALPESIRQPFSRPHGEGDYLMYEPHLGTVSITGPFNARGAHDTPSRERIFSCYPSQPAQETPCAGQILANLARRAYRRPVGDAEVTRFLAFYNEGHAEGGFEPGIERALRAILVSPDFLYRVEAPSIKAASGGVSPLSDLELASRLSFFLWSSIPDEDLIQIASQGRLHDPAVLEQQVRRMLKDQRSSALAANFAGQWLRLRNVLGQEPDDVLFPNFNDNLRHDFVKETELFFGSIVQENRSVIDLLTADYSYLNETLANFYGMPNVHGNYFRRVTLSDPNRRGLLGQASILTVTSLSNRTSPVGRGKWILENVLGAPPPPKPANVPDLPQNGEKGKFLSMREMMAEHRANPACAGCHARMDPIGFAMENFDAVGRWRTIAENGGTIDASGVLPDGTKFNGPAELRGLLAKNPDQFVTVVAEKLFVYALGRGIEYYDEPTIRQMVRGASHDNYSFASLVLQLVKSTPFMERSAPPQQTAKERGIQ